MSKTTKRTPPPSKQPLQEPVEVPEEFPPSMIQSRETFQRVEVRGEAAPDSSQNVSAPRGLAVPGNNPVMRRDSEQEALLRAVPAASPVPGAAPLAEHSVVRSPIAEDGAASADFSAERVTHLHAQSPYEEPIETHDEPLVTVKPRSAFDCFIGGSRWYFEKDKPVRVPLSVKEILARGEMIYP